MTSIYPLGVVGGRRAMMTLMLAVLLLSAGCAGKGASAANSQEPDLETMAGQMIMAGFRGADPEQMTPGLEAIFADVEAGRVGGVVLFDYDVVKKERGRNIVSKEQVARLTRALQNHRPDDALPVLIAVDQEGGHVARLKPSMGFPEAPSAFMLGRKGDLEATQAAGRLAGEALVSAGCNLNLAPVADVHNPANPVIGGIQRSFGLDPWEVAKQVQAYVKGLHQAGVLGCLKHFPGHGSAFNDSHKGMVDATPFWTNSELAPFQKTIQAGLADAVMTAHIFIEQLDNRYPATLSSRIIQGQLRHGLGYDGVVISDDMQMRALTDEYGQRQAVRQAVLAGVDILLFGNNLEYDPQIAARVQSMLVEDVRAGAIPLSRIQESYARIQRMKTRLAQGL